MKLTKQCCTCKQELPLSQFTKAKQAKDGLNWRCKTCCSVANKKTREGNAKGEKERARRNHIQRTYNCTVAEYEERMATSPVCEICGTAEDLVYDHCHETMAFRGVLCRKHNSAIGLLGDTLESVSRAINYLKDK